jgi:lipopolysaccharide/colanic/teichoic acid biosynthesis glycosyltransferase
MTHFSYRESRVYGRLRRVVDVIVACAALLIAAPILAAAALAIVLEDGWPVFFRQQRVGRFGRLFVMYKLRTMTTCACVDARKPSGSADRRLTRTGRALRRTSIDELPQFVNVIRGEMSVVGPRPEMPFIVKSYERWQHLRLLVPPGITGLWQTACRSTIELNNPEATRLDLDYIRQASTFRDVALIARTIRAVLSMRGAV